MLLTLVDLSPPLLLLYDSANTDSSFWTLFHRLLVLMNRQNPHLSPTNDFSALVEQLYLVRDRLDFSSVDDLAILANLLPQNREAGFWFWGFPTKIDNPPLFFETLLHLHELHSPAWNGFLTTPGMVDRIFDRWLPALEGAAAPLLEFLTTLIVGRIPLLTNPVDVCEGFWNRLMANLQAKDKSVIANSFRSAALLFQASRSCFPTGHQSVWAFQLIEATQSPSIVHRQALNFVMRARIPAFKYVKLATVLVSGGLKEPSDFAFLRLLLLHPQLEKPLPAIQHLVSVSINDRLFARAAASAVKEPFYRFSDIQVVMTWGTLFARRAFMFVGLSAAQKKYSAKRHRVLSLFEGLLDMPIEWLSRVVLRCYASLVNRNILPHTVVGFALEKTIDFKFLNDLEQAQRHHVPLKTCIGTCSAETDFQPLASRASSSRTQNEEIPAKFKPIASPIITRNTNTPRVKRPVPARALVAHSPSIGLAPLGKASPPTGASDTRVHVLLPNVQRHDIKL
jgi:hypothetical protein